MELKESFDNWIAETIDADDQSGRDLFFYTEVMLFFKWHEAQQNQPITKPTSHSIYSLYEAGKISVRAFNVMNATKINTLEELSNYNQEDLKKLRNMGSKSIFELEKLMEEHGISFK